MPLNGSKVIDTVGVKRQRGRASGLCVSVRYQWYTVPISPLTPR
jgi:hypothetical protein